MDIAPVTIVELNNAMGPKEQVLFSRWKLFPLSSPICQKMEKGEGEFHEKLFIPGVPGPDGVGVKKSKTAGKPIEISRLMFYIAHCFDIEQKKQC